MAKDANHEMLCRAFRAAGAGVVTLHTLGKGIPDILVGYAGSDQLVEIKLPTRRDAFGASPKTHLSRKQKTWHSSWQGQTPVVVRTPEEAEALLDRMYEARSK